MQIVLVHPRIPQNAGALARLAAATHSRLTLVRPLGFRVDAAAVRRAGLDYWEAANVQTVESLEDALAETRGTAFFFSTRGKQSYLDARYSLDDALVFGSETEGLPENVLAAAPTGRVLRIPILNPAVRSLNLAASASIALYEALRQIKTDAPRD